MTFVANSVPELRRPKLQDGLQLQQLIAASPPLDCNSIYSYYLLASHFRDTCVVADMEGAICGFISAYLRPDSSDTLFVWQVVVAAAMRKRGLAQQMLQQLLARDVCNSVRYVEATVNPHNSASRQIFERLAQQQQTILQQQMFLAPEAFGKDNHDAEILLRVALHD